MNCPSCAEPVKPGQRFCAACGTRLERACGVCGEPLPDGARFCPSCGSPVEGTAMSARAVDRAEVAGGADGPPGEPDPVVERRFVSILFVDLVGFTELATRLDPEDVRDLQSRYFARAREIVERYGGLVEKYVGDAVMAAWGTPTSREDDAERAVRAGLDVVAAIPAIPIPGHTTPAAGVPEPQLLGRAGVATGLAAVSVGSDGQGRVSGEAVNLAARLEAAADAGSVLVDEATRRAAEASIVLEAAGHRPLKGFAQPVAAWRGLRVVAGRAGSGRADELEAPFIGRVGELTLLKELFHATARERRLRVVSVTGQAGIGKSRLAWEFEKYVDGITGDVYWHQGRSPAYGEGITFWALGEMVRRRAGVLEDDDDATTSAKVKAMLEIHVEDEGERMRLAPALAVLLGTDHRSPGERGELFGAWRTLFERIADRGPVVLVLEDLQWADAGLIAFVDHLLEWSRQQPIFVLTLARPELLERFPTWGAGQRNFTSIHIEPLAPDEMRQLLGGLVPGLPAPTVRAILRRAEGVPLYAIETVRMLVADGVLVRDGDAYRVERSVEEVSIPPSLQALVAARLDGVAPADRAILQQAAVLGSSFSLDGLAAISGQDEQALAASVGRLAAREIIRLDTDPRSPERGQYQFVQAVIREVAYETLTRRDRKERHLAAARYFESRGDEELAGALARHYVDAWRATAGGPEADTLAAQARVALRAAADRAILLHSYHQALAFLTLALDVATDDAERAAILERAADAAWHAARVPEAESLLRRALDIHRSRGDDVGVARLTLRIGFVFNSSGRNREAVELLSAGVEALAASHPGEERLAAELDAQLARGLFLLRDHPRAIELADRAIAAAERLDVPEVLVDALITRGSAIGQSRPREGQAILLGAAALADRYGLTRAGLRARNNVYGWIENEDPRAAAELGDEVLALARRLGMRDEVLWALSGRVFRLLWDGDTDGARAIVEETFEDEPLPDMIRLFMLEAASGLALMEGRDEASRSHLAAAGAVSEKLTNPEYLASLDLTRGTNAYIAGDPNAAAEWFLAGKRRSGDPSAWTFLWTAKALVHAGRLEEARQELAAAEAAPDRGAGAEAARLALRAVVAAGEGGPAVQLFGEAIRAWQELGKVLDRAFTQLDFVLLVGPAEPAARAAGEELRALCLEKGWHGLLRRVDEALGRPAVADGDTRSTIAGGAIAAGEGR